MSDQFDYPGSAATPPASPRPAAPPPASPRRRSSGGLASWLIAALIVLILAVAGGLFTAWIVANMRAVPGPVAAATATPTTPTSSAAASSLPSTSVEPTEGPPRTPTPLPTVEMTLAPFVHVVQKGESLNYIAALYQVDVQGIIDLNNIKNPNLIAVGQELLIPGYGIQPTPKPTKSPKG